MRNQIDGACQEEDHGLEHEQEKRGATAHWIAMTRTGAHLEPKSIEDQKNITGGMGDVKHIPSTEPAI